MRPVVAQFLTRGLSRTQRGRSSTQLSNRRCATQLGHGGGAVIAFVYVVGVGFFWRTQVALDVTSWYGVSADGRLQPSLAGWWLGCVTLPLWQFLLLRWYFRLFVWARFLWRVSRIALKIVPTPGRLRRYGLSGASELRVGAAFAGSRDFARRTAGRPDFLRRREAARIQLNWSDWWLCWCSPSSGRCWYSVHNSRRPSAGACSSTVRWRSSRRASSKTMAAWRRAGGRAAGR